MLGIVAQIILLVALLVAVTGCFAAWSGQNWGVLTHRWGAGMAFVLLAGALFVALLLLFID